VRGSVRTRGSTYTWYLDVPDPVTGRRRQRSKGGYRTKKACQAALNDALATLRAGSSWRRPSKRTLASYLVGEWLPAMQPPRVRPSTWLSYQRSLERHVIPALGETELQRLTPAVLTAFYRSLLTAGRLDSRGGLSAKSVKNIHGALHVALGDAVRWGYVARNAADATDRRRSPPPRCRCGTPLSSAPSSPTCAATACTRPGCCSPPPGCAAARCRAALGRRRPGRRPGQPAQAAVQVNYQVHVSEPKTAKGKRSLALDPATVAALKEHRVRQASERLAVGAGWQDSGLVFTWGDGRPLHPERFSRWFDRLAREAGLPKIRLHDVRHSYATAALPPGCPPRWSASAWATPTSRSRWTPTATSCPAWTSSRPAPSPG
jgi:hypothetical protein